MGSSSRGPIKAPIPYGSRGVLSEKSAQLGPTAGIRPHDPTKGLGSRAANLGRMEVSAARAMGRGEYPAALDYNALARPEQPGTSQPLHRIHDPALRWGSRYPVRPTVGDWLPREGVARPVADGIEGGRALPFGHSFPRATVERLLPFDSRAKHRMRAFNLEVRRLRMLAKRRVILTGGLSGPQAAKALRGKPGTPGGFQGSGRQEAALPNALRGRRREQDFAPTPTLLRIANEARRYGGRV